MQDPLAWLPGFFSDHWVTSLDSLRAGGVNVTTAKPHFAGAQDPKSGGDVQSGVIVKIYEAGSLVAPRLTHGDLDKDPSWRFTLDVKRDGNTPGTARTAVAETLQVLERTCELFRSNPHPDWNRIEDVEQATVQNYANYQHRTLTFTLKRFGQVLPPAIRRDES